MVHIRPEDRAEYRERLRIRVELALWKIIIVNAIERELRAYDPGQPRVPAGNPDGGQWTSDGGGGDGSVQVAELLPDPHDPNRVISDAGSGDGTRIAQDVPRSARPANRSRQLSRIACEPRATAGCPSIWPSGC